MSCVLCPCPPSPTPRDTVPYVLNSNPTRLESGGAPSSALAFMRQIEPWVLHVHLLGAFVQFHNLKLARIAQSYRAYPYRIASWLSSPQTSPTALFEPSFLWASGPRTKQVVASRHRHLTRAAAASHLIPFFRAHPESPICQSYRLIDRLTR